MPVPFYRTLRKGMRPSAKDTNDMAKALNANAPISGGYDGSRPDPCMFYTAEDIPPYSIFPLAGWMQNRLNSLETCFLVEQYDATEGVYYGGYFGTNGPYAVKGGNAFIGHVIEHTVDHPVVIDGYDVSKGVYCGFKDGSWAATQDTDGLIITGKCPEAMGSNVYFVRKSQDDCCDKLQNDRFACLETTLTAGGNVTAKEWETGEEFTVYASPLLCDGETISACAIVQASWFPQYGKWYVVAVGGDCNCDCGSSGGSAPDESVPDSSGGDSSAPDESSGDSWYCQIWYGIDDQPAGAPEISYVYVAFCGVTSQTEQADFASTFPHPVVLWATIPQGTYQLGQERQAVYDYTMAHISDVDTRAANACGSDEGEVDCFTGYQITPAFYNKTFNQI